MSSTSAARAQQVITAVHYCAAILPLVCLVTVLIRLTGAGFQPDRELYPSAKNPWHRTAPFILRAWRKPAGKVVAVYGLGTEPLGPEAHSILALQTLAEGGVVLRVVSPQAEAAELLPESATLVPDLATAATGANALLIYGQGDRRTDLDYAALAPLMRGHLVFDLTGLVDSFAADQAGLQVIEQAAPLGPPWLDPDLRRYAAHLRAKVPEDEAVLVVLALPPGTVSGRARWFLHLNNLLFPRRIYMQDSFRASGTSVQYREWTIEMTESFPGRRQRRWEPDPRELSRVTQVGPVRTLNREEKQAIEELGIQWVTFYTANSDFRVQDWETLPVDRALAGQ